MPRQPIAPTRFARRKRKPPLRRPGSTAVPEAVARPMPTFRAGSFVRRVLKPLRHPLKGFDFPAYRRRCSRKGYGQEDPPRPDHPGRKPKEADPRGFERLRFPEYAGGGKAIVLDRAQCGTAVSSGARDAEGALSGNRMGPRATPPCKGQENRKRQNERPAPHPAVPHSGGERGAWDQRSFVDHERVARFSEWAFISQGQKAIATSAGHARPWGDPL